MSVVDLFCGCGGLSRGFQDESFDIVAAFDAWHSAITCYNANNLENHGHLLDLSNLEAAVSAIRPYSPKVIIGGPPCQDFSDAGKRTEGDRANLTYIFAQIITRIRPQYFVMENVPRSKKSEAYTNAREEYKQAGYGLTEVVLDASRCGVPQRRKRFFCIGALNSDDGFLTGILMKYYNKPEKTVRAFFDEKGYTLDIEAFYRHPTTYARRGVYSVNEVSPTIRGVNRPKPGTYTRHEKDAVSVEALPDIRSLTVRERAYIQTFPANYVFDNLNISKGDLEQIIGNAVPIELAKLIAKSLKKYMEGVRLERDSGFANWLRSDKKYGDRTIGDIFSRINRAMDILPERPLNRYFITDLDQTDSFSHLGTDVKSQIRNAIRLRIAYEDLAVRD